MDVIQVIRFNKEISVSEQRSKTRKKEKWEVAEAQKAIKKFVII
jgi:hypothetical protein